ncbi:MAG: anti-sigma factor [Actinomycetales bacterium]
MRHPDPEALALTALGEDVLDPDGQAHVLTCDTCHDEVAALCGAVDAARGVAPAPRSSFEILAEDTAAPPPPSRVWQGIAAELGLEHLAPGTATGTRPGRPSLTPVPPSRPAGRRDRSTGPLASARPAHPGAGRGVRPRRGRGLRLLATAAVAVLAAVVGSAGTAWWLGRPGQQSESRVVLAASLSPVPDSPPGSGTAEILTGEPTGPGGQPGGAELRLTLDELPEVPGYHGVWLIDPESGQMVSLGVLPGAAGTAAGTFVVPPGLDLSAYTLVDVSDEPLDGDPTHSGVSLLRGTLAAAAAAATATA